MEKKSILEGITEHDVVEVFNPLKDTFIGKVGRSIIVNSKSNPSGSTGNASADAYLQQLANQPKSSGHSSKAHVQQTVEIPAGQTRRMTGDVAQVVVRQLVKEMMQRGGAKTRMADPLAFMEYEKQVVINHESMLNNLSVETIEQRFQRQMDELNPTGSLKEIEDEQAFPDATGASTGLIEGPAVQTPGRRGRQKRITVPQA